MILLLAGEIASGKTALAAALAIRHGFQVVSARAALCAMTGASPSDRLELQRRGAELDRRTAGRWLLEYLVEHASGASVVVDSVRTRRQTVPILEGRTEARLVFIHTSVERRRARYAQALKADALKASTTFDRAMAHATEREVRLLEPLADLRVEGEDETPEVLADRVISHFQLP